MEGTIIFRKTCLYYRPSRWAWHDGAFEPRHGRSSPNSEQSHNHCVWR